MNNQVKRFRLEVCLWFIIQLCLGQNMFVFSAQLLKPVVYHTTLSRAEYVCLQCSAFEACGLSYNFV